MNLLAWRYKRFHVSYVLGWLAVGILIGIGISRIFSLEVTLLWVISILFIIVTQLRVRRWWTMLIMLLCGLALGQTRGNETLSSFAIYEGLRDKGVSVAGRIADDPVRGRKGEVSFGLIDATRGTTKLPGEIYVSSFTKADIKRGDKVVFKGKLGEGFGSYQAKLGYGELVNAVDAGDPVRDFRDEFSSSFRRVVDEPAASLGIGFVVGQRSALPSELDDNLRIVGLTHIVVASGYNLTILVRFARRILEGKSKYLAASTSGGLMLLFIVVSGLSPSMVRASIVTGLSLLAWYYGRRFHPLLLIIYVAAFTAYLNPVYVWADVGWYLSFLAFMGVLIVSPLLVKVIFKEKKPHPILQVACETSAAQIMTLPLILMLFGTLPVLSLLSNVLVALVIPLAMLLTALTGIIAMVSISLASFLGIFAELILGYVLAVVAILSSPEWAQIAISISPIVMIGMYVTVSIVTITVYIRLRFNFRSQSIVD